MAVQNVELSALLFTDWFDRDRNQRLLDILTEAGWAVSRPGEWSLPAFANGPVNAKAWYASDLFRDISMVDLVIFDVDYRVPVLGDLLHYCVETMAVQGKINCMGYHWYVMRDTKFKLDLSTFCESAYARCINGLASLPLK